MVAPIQTLSAKDLKEFVCPQCKPKRNVLVKAAPGSVVEVYCRHCKYRKVVVI